MSNRARTTVSQQIAVRMPLAELADLDAARQTEQRAAFVRRAIQLAVRQALDTQPQPPPAREA